MSQRVPFSPGLSTQVASESMAAGRHKVFSPRQQANPASSQEPPAEGLPTDAENSFLTGRPRGQTRRVFHAMSRQGNPGTTPSSAGIVAPVHGPTMPPPKADQTHHQPALASLYQSFKSPKPSNSILHRHSFLGTQLPRGPPAQKHAPAMMESVQHSIIESSRSNSVVDSDDDTLCNEIQSASAGKGTGGNIVAQSPSRVVAMNAFPKPRLSLQEVERPTKRRRIFHAQQKSIDRASTPITITSNAGGRPTSPICVDDIACDDTAVSAEAKVEIKSPIQLSSSSTIGNANGNKVTNWKDDNSPGKHVSKCHALGINLPAETESQTITFVSSIRPFSAASAFLSAGEREFEQYIGQYPTAWKERSTHWAGCDMETWLAGANGILSTFGELFDRVQEGFDADIHAFGDQDATLEDHEKNVLDRRDEMLRQVRETIVAGSGSILSGSLSTVARTNDN